MTSLIPIVWLIMSDGSSWNTFVTRSFRVDTSGPPNYVASVSWFGNAKDPLNGKSPGSTMIDLYELNGIDDGKQLSSSTKVGEGIWVSSLAIHRFVPHESYEDAQGSYHKFFPINFLTLEANGGQHSHMLVWWFNPRTMRPERLLDVLYGDFDRLEKHGQVIENRPAQYVRLPKGLKPRRGYVRRTWTFDEKRFSFLPGPWRR